MKNLRLTGVAAALAVLAGCGGPVVIDPAPVDPRVTMYDVTSIDDGGRPRLLVDRDATRVTFYGKRIDVIGGCNVLSGSYRLEGAQLNVSGLAATTNMPCEPEAVAEDAWFVQLFSRPVTFVDGPTASVTSGNVTLTLTELHHRWPEAPLLGTVWVLESWFHGTGLGTWADRRVDATLTLTSDERRTLPALRQPTSFRVNAGCAGHFSGAVSVRGRMISWQPTTFDRPSCTPGSAGAEAEARHLVEVLDGATVFMIEGDSLVVTGLAGDGDPEPPRGEMSLRFHRASSRQ